MDINKDTKVCISLAERPGNFGATLFNAAFTAVGLNYIYKPFKVTTENLKAAIDGIRAYGIIGCGVSMPHKIEVIKYLDEIDETAKKIGAINTIINRGGHLIGYNIDFIGAQKALSECYNVVDKTAVVIGAGGAARAVVMALKKSGISSIRLVNRNERKGRFFSQEFGLHYYSYYDKIAFIGADLLINATPVGMSPNDQEMPVNKDLIDNFTAVMDVVIYPNETILLQTAKKLNKIIISGLRMSLHQAAAQFELYTG